MWNGKRKSPMREKKRNLEVEVEVEVRKRKNDKYTHLEIAASTHTPSI